MGKPLQTPAGPLWDKDVLDDDDEDSDSDDRDDKSKLKRAYIPQVSLHERDGRTRKRVLVLCTGGTLTMAPRDSDGSLAPVQGALSAATRVRESSYRPWPVAGHRDIACRTLLLVRSSYLPTTR